MDDLITMCHQMKPTTIILDIEPWVVPWSDSAESLGYAIANIQPRLPEETRLVICSNSPRFKHNMPDAIEHLDNPRKPFTHLDLLGNLGERPLVLGDSLFTEGLLALRVNATFAWLKWEGNTPIWPRSIHCFDRIIGGILLKSLPTQAASIDNQPLTGDIESRQLDALFQEYAHVREDERYFTNFQVAAFAIAVTVLSLLAALANELDEGKHVSPALIAATPMAVLAILALSQAAGVEAVVRSFYTRAVERELRKRLKFRNNFSEYPGLTPMSYAELRTSVTTLAHGSSFPRIMTAIIAITLWGSFGGIVVYLSLSISPPWRMAMMLIYPIGAWIIFSDAVRINTKGRQLFERYVSDSQLRITLPLTPNGSQEPPRKERSIWSYLLLPRPDDLIKTMFVAAGALFSWLTLGKESQAPEPNLVEIILFIISLELLIYQSRYQWNDIRGVFEDTASPLSMQRGRLPGGRAGVRRSIAVIFIKLYLVFWVISIQWSPGGRVSRVDHLLMWSIAAVFGLAVIYEVARSHERSTSRCGPLNCLAICILVGIGYPLRFAFGWWAVGGEIPSSDFAVILVSIWGLGVAFVTLTWVLEGVSYVYGSLTCGREITYLASEAIHTKQHLLHLLQFSGFPIRVGDNAPASPLKGANIRVLKLKQWSRITPWSLGFSVWTACMSLVAGPILGDDTARPWHAGATAFLISFFPLKYAGGLISYISASLILILGFLTHALSLPSGLQEEFLNPLTGLELIMICFMPPLLFTFFYRASYEDTRTGMRQVTQVIKVGILNIGRWIIGSPR